MPQIWKSLAASTRIGWYFGFEGMSQAQPFSSRTRLTVNREFLTGREVRLVKGQQVFRLFHVPITQITV